MKMHGGLMTTSPRPTLMLAIVLCTAGLGCEQPVAPLLPAAPPPVFVVASVAGQVIDADTGEPVPGAVVTVAAFAGPGTSAVTDGSGAFRLEPHGIAIESAPGESVDVDLVPPTGPDNGLELQADAYLETLELKRRLTVTGGAVWIRGDSSPVTLTARRP
jgi:hypothetical protein